MELIDIVRRDAESMSDVLVVVDTAYETVSIQDCQNFLDEIFLQGDEAAEFIGEAQRLWDELQHVSMEQCYLYLAKPYTESIWN
ncbi:hypothetical protein [Pusillimonas sp.]|uniref:hypothetical protein n=1 Tax=Pusillimonas sp. TaxID=3040095 RepID=UPI0037CB6DA5